jgi:hypothetical protein
LLPSADLLHPFSVVVKIVYGSTLKNSLTSRMQCPEKISANSLKRVLFLLIRKKESHVDVHGFGRSNVPTVMGKVPDAAVVQKAPEPRPRPNGLKRFVPSAENFVPSVMQGLSHRPNTADFTVVQQAVSSVTLLI